MTPERETILIVDDTPENLDILVGILRGAYRLKVATDGEAALELAAAAPPNLILLDVMMPGVDGFEVCRRLKADQALRDVPVTPSEQVDSVLMRCVLSSRDLGSPGSCRDERTLLLTELHRHGGGDSAVSPRLA